ncbi:LAME_0F08834g1_1 [Lachancea meyersii CBS 8951]|uniref:LAME_0F08834g1_1 n=1 Tax=Lachancea meyersii CBS 8951 TaxID=1266667 RepID=A0A1G4JV07_9SACH|nr:LAME_0F08834g1_1 [Lachancea meyersii CBS 8951]
MLTSQLFGLICYVLTYVRYVRDNSLSNVILSVLVVVISQVLHQMVTMYYKKSQRADQGQEQQDELSTIFKILLKCLKYFQAIFAVQFVAALLYHSTLDIEKDVCSWKQGYIFTDIIGEFDCGRGGKWALFALDTALLLCQLLTFNECFTVSGRDPSETVREASMEGFNPHEFGVLSILRFDSFGVHDQELVFTSEQNRLGSQANKVRYGSVLTRDL